MCSRLIGGRFAVAGSIRLLSRRMDSCSWALRLTAKPAQSSALLFRFSLTRTMAHRPVTPRSRCGPHRFFFPIYFRAIAGLACCPCTGMGRTIGFWATRHRTRHSAPSGLAIPIQAPFTLKAPTFLEIDPMRLRPACFRQSTIKVILWRWGTKTVGYGCMGYLATWTPLQPAQPMESVQPKQAMPRQCPRTMNFASPILSSADTSLVILQGSRLLGGYATCTPPETGIPRISGWSLWPQVVCSPQP